MAIGKFQQIKLAWQDCAVEEGEEIDEYTDNNFLIDAAVALVLAGTSIAELIGQNVPTKLTPKGAQTEHLRPAYKLLVADPIPGDVEEFFKIYDDLRHFGPAKHVSIKAITEETVCEYMATAQQIWIDVLRKTRGSVANHFQNVFKFED